MALDVPALGDDAVVLRPPTEDDVDAITTACQDPDISRFTRVPSPYSRADAEGFVASVRAGWDDETAPSLAIFDADDARLVGMIGVMRLDTVRTVAEIGYWVARPDRGRGVATRALRLASRWAVLEVGVRRLELMASVENVASQHVATASGFTREGVLRSYTTLSRRVADVVMFSLLPSDLEA
jgi:RimJ/RimL family protein N-acetyltransferase